MMVLIPVQKSTQMNRDHVELYLGAKWKKPLGSRPVRTVFGRLKKLRLVWPLVSTCEDPRPNLGYKESRPVPLLIRTKQVLCRKVWRETMLSITNPDRIDPPTKCDLSIRYQRRRSPGTKLCFRWKEVVGGHRFRGTRRRTRERRGDAKRTLTWDGELGRAWQWVSSSARTQATRYYW